MRYGTDPTVFSNGHASSSSDAINITQIAINSSQTTDMPKSGNTSTPRDYLKSARLTTEAMKAVHDLPPCPEHPRMLGESYTHTGGGGGGGGGDTGVPISHIPDIF